MVSRYLLNQVQYHLWTPEGSTTPYTRPISGGEEEKNCVVPEVA